MSGAAEDVRASWEWTPVGFVALVWFGGRHRDALRCPHLHRTKTAAQRCGSWTARRWSRGQCICRCHQDARELTAGCCACL